MTMRLPRLHLVELEDVAWLPRRVRDYATDYLEFIERAWGLHRPVTPLLRDLLRTTGSRTIVDLCSGGAGPLPVIVEELRRQEVQVEVLLTDKFPNLDAFRRAEDLSGGAITFRSEPLDARSIPPELTGVRTLFNAFHHFAPPDGRAILRDAVEARQPIAVFDMTERRPIVVLSTLLAPVAVLLATPFIRPFHWRRLLLTYVLPLVPFTCLWDGIVSQLRAYTADELEQLAADVSTGATGDYVWTAGQASARGVPVRLTYLMGHPTIALQ